MSDPGLGFLVNYAREHYFKTATLSQYNIPYVQTRRANKNPPHSRTMGGFLQALLLGFTVNRLCGRRLARPTNHAQPHLHGLSRPERSEAQGPGG